MEFVTVIAIYFVVWWISLFAVLPWGVRQAQDRGEGHMPGAPERPRFKKIFLTNTFVAVVLTAAILGLFYLGEVPLRIFPE